MATPTPITGGQAVKFVLFFGGGKYGWTESFYGYIKGNGTPSLAQCKTFAGNLVKIRRAVLHSAYNLEAVRVEFLGGDGAGESLIFEAPDANCGPGFDGTGDPAPVWMAWWGTERDSSGTLRGQRNFRGMSLASISGWAPGLLQPAAGVPQKVDEFFKQLSGLLGDSFKLTPGLTLFPVVPGYDRPNAIAKAQAVQLVSLGASNNVILTMASPINGLTNGSIIAIHAKRIRCSRGLSGRATVTSVNPGPPNQVITTSKMFSCPPNNLGLLTVSATQILGAYYPYATWNANGGGTYQPVAPTKIAKKSTGRPFFGTRGRQSSRAC